MRDETGVGAAPKGGRAASDSLGDGTKAVEKERAETFESAAGAEIDEDVFLFGKHKTGREERWRKARFRIKWETRANRRDGRNRNGAKRRLKETRNPARRADVSLIVKESAALKMRGAKFPPN